MYFVEKLDFSGANALIQKFVVDNNVVNYVGTAMYMVAAFLLGREAVFSFNTWLSMRIASTSRPASPGAEEKAGGRSEPKDWDGRISYRDWEKMRESYLNEMSRNDLEKEIIGVLWDASDAAADFSPRMTRNMVYDTLPSKESYSRRAVYAALASLARRNKIHSSMNEHDVSDRKILWSI